MRASRTGGWPGRGSSANVGSGDAGLRAVAWLCPVDIAGAGIANPVGALLSSCAYAWKHLGEPQAAGRLRQAVLDTVGKWSAYRRPGAAGPARTQFVRAVCARLV